ncbi:MAG: methyltransferase domain-containing protein [Pseudomonadota bacterium]
MTIQPVQAPCVICGGAEFAPGPLGRVSGRGYRPRCMSCRALERHRIVRQIYDALPDDLIGASDLLQFSPDNGAPHDRFKSVEFSVFGGDNNLNLMDIDRPDGRYDWVIANHVLEHVSDDRKALAEMLRVVRDSGIVQISIPSPCSALETIELEPPVPDISGHWREYGSDFPLIMAPVLQGVRGLSIAERDRSTDTWDVCYFFSRSPDTIRRVGQALLKARIPTLRCV